MNNIITIVTPSFNQGHFINEAIESVLSQEGKFYIDYTLVDGLSTDNSVEVIKKYEQMLIQNCEVKELNGLKFYVNKDPSKFNLNNCLGISYRWLSEKDKGHANGINKGIKMMKGSMFGFLNADDFYEDCALSTVIENFGKGSQVVCGNGFRTNQGGDVIDLYPSIQTNPYKLLDNCIFPQPSVFIKSSVIEKIGLFNENLKNGLDYEYWLRIQNAGISFTLVRDVLSSTRMYQDTKTVKNAGSILMENLAFSSHYGKQPSWKHQFEYVRQISLIGKFADFTLRAMKFLQNKFLYYFSKIYFLFFRQKIDNLEKQIFKS